MRRHIFTLGAAVSLVSCVSLLLSPHFVSAHHYWISTLIGEFGPFEQGSLFIPLLMVLSAAVPIWWLVVSVRRRILEQPMPGHCCKCSYNLTGNMSGVCPECGSPIPPPVKAPEPL